MRERERDEVREVVGRRESVKLVLQVPVRTLGFSQISWNEIGDT
jgi:hypothetical protein